MSIWQCKICGYQYDPAEGEETRDISPGTPFEALPKTWLCPKCDGPKHTFEELDDAFEEEGVTPEDAEEDDSALEEDQANDLFDMIDDEGLDEEDLEDSEEDEEEYDEEPDLDEEFDRLDEEDFDEEFDEEYEEDEDELMPEQEVFDLEEFERMDIPDEEDDPENEEEDQELNEEDEEDFEEDYEDEIPEYAEYLDDDAFDDDEEEDDGGLEDVEDFDEEGMLDDLDSEFSHSSSRFACSSCGWIYDPAVGHPATEIGRGTPFLEIRSGWTCPSCGASRSRFRVQEASQPLTPSAVLAHMSLNQDGVDAIEHLADTGKPSSQLAMPRKLSCGLGDLLLRPGPLFAPKADETATTLTLIGSGTARPLHLTTPIVVAPIPFGALTDPLKLAIANATARVGTACTSGGLFHSTAMEAASIYILELYPGRPMPTADELHSADAVEIQLGHPWSDTSKSSEAVEGERLVGPVGTRKDLSQLLTDLRNLVRGPIGIRFPAGSLEEDLEAIMEAGPDYLVLSCYGSAFGYVPRHVREHAYVPAWLAVHQARNFLDSKGHDRVSVLVGGDLRTPADFAKILALGADAVVISISAVLAMGLWDLRPRVERARQYPIESRFDTEQSADRLVNFLKAATEELMDFCRLVGKTDIHELEPGDLLTGQEELSRILGLKRVG